MRLNLTTSFIGLSLLSMAVYAEPPLQAGDTLESLSKVRIQITVNGQPISTQDPISSDQIQQPQGASPPPVSASNPGATRESTLPTLPEPKQPSKRPSKAPLAGSTPLPDSTQVPDTPQMAAPTEPADYPAPPDQPSSSKPVMPGDIIPLPKPVAPNAAPDTLPPINSPVPNQPPQDRQRQPATTPNPEQPDGGVPTPNREQPDAGTPAKRNITL